ncbi:site-specific integrase [Roseibium sp. FZY0029]|uniref:tyrosine-type recombinase/integrase n=1 Tax=Roseibium sp. FZY0029 TaxID=3116647 RepID=UPI002ECB3A08|nr:site-specific integrase [Roseibium sp. FZY0029]
MDRYNVRHFTSSKGEETHMLMCPNGIPSYWPNYYASAVLRDQALSPKTIRNHLNSICRASNWMLARENVDFADRVMRDNPLAFEEATALAKFLQLTAKAQQTELKLIKATKTQSENQKVRKLEKIRPSRRSTTHTRLEVIEDEPYASTLRNIASFLEWIYRQRRFSDGDAEFGHEQWENAIEGLNQFHSNVPRLSNKGDQDESLEGLSREVVQIIEDTVNPHSPENPWQDHFVRDRNYLIWRLFLETGGRRDEVHNIVLANLQMSQGNVTFHVSKTAQRTVPFRPATCILIDEFIQQHWSKLPKWSRKAGYLITSKDGHPLSQRQINRIFEEIRNRNDRIPDYVTPHTMRRTWNEFFSQMIDASENAPSLEMERRIRNRLMGWSENSRSADKYLRRHIRRKADELNEKLFEDAETVSNPKWEMEIANDD